MFESFGFDTFGPREASVLLGLVLGLAFGALARLTGFCLRRAVDAPAGDRRAALGLWMAALASAIAGTQVAVALGWVDFSDHRFLVANMPVLAITLGGLMFGAGMVLTRGCVSRLTVLAAGGNLRAALVMVVFAVIAHATLKGILAPVRVSLAEPTVSLGEAASLAALPGGAIAATALLTLGAAYLVLRARLSATRLGLGIALGLLVPLGWVGTGFVLYDDFDPIALESLSFIAPATESLFWVIASTAVPAGFGTGLLGGVLAGSFLTALATDRKLSWVSFESPGQTGRYLAGAALMGVGGVLAGGCTVGAGLAGVPTLGTSAALALTMIYLGGRATALALSGAPSTAAAGEQGTTRPGSPAA